jgi:triosephosphate isomerase
MRPYVIAGNWKMFKDRNESAELIDGLLTKLPASLGSTTVVICPPFTSLSLANRLLDGSAIKLGGQNLYPADEGAYTGEISAKMLLSVGCQYVILGHSERRQYFAETNDFINRKVKKALAAGLTPIVCVGETLTEREKNITSEIVSSQVNGCLKDLSPSEVQKLILAYEPVWAIGTGRTATPSQAQEVHAMIRSLLSPLVGKEAAGKIILQYGGSVKPENASDLFGQPDINGALVGGACLNADSFVSIIQAALA